jgi:peptidoglycan hydrolase CwlO-like protein
MIKLKEVQMHKRLIALGVLVVFGLGLLAGCGASKQLIADMEAACQAADDAEARLASLESQLQTLQSDKTAKETRIQELEQKIAELESAKPSRGTGGKPERAEVK